MVCSIRLGVASIYSGARGPTRRKVSSSWSTVQTAIGVGDGRGGAVLPAILNDTVARRGAVWFGRNATVLFACSTEDLMAHSARGPRGGERACLRGCWDGGDHVCTR